MDGPAPAIVNAVVDATGTNFDFVPLMPENIFAEVSKTLSPDGER
jgi:CO/xanthine dehydrogenase Mo-binding subunit